MNIPQYVTQLTKDWFRSVSKKRVQGTCIRIDEAEGSYTIGVDLEALEKLLDIKPDNLTHEDITDWDAATAGFLTDDDYDTLSGAITDLSEIVDEILTELDGYLTVDDIGVTVAEEDHTHTTADISNWGTATADFLTDADMSAYALDADLAALEEDVADIADLVDAIDTDLYDASGNKAWVDLSTAQTVGGVKTFSAITKHNSHIEISGSNSLRMFLNRNNGVQGWESISFFTLDGVNIGQVICGNDSASVHGTYLRSYNGGSIYSGIGVHLDVNDKGSQTLERPPTEDTSSTSDTQIAWRGWVNNYFSRKTHHHDDVYSKLGHTHSGYASTNHTHSGYATTSSVNTLSNALTELTNIVNTINEEYVTQNALTTKLSVYSTTDQISGSYVSKAEFNSLDAEVGEIDDDLMNIIGMFNNGYSENLTVVTDVKWNGSVIVVKKSTINFGNGLATGVAGAVGNTISTVVYNPN